MEIEQKRDSENRKTARILLATFALLVILSIGASFYKFFIARDYIIETQIDCDPTTEACFVSECDPTADTCTGNPDEDTTYYKILNREAKNIPLCDETKELCEASECLVGEGSCSITLCGEGSKCSSPDSLLEKSKEDDSTILDSQGEQPGRASAGVAE